MRYDEDYFERGQQLGISGYTNYRWLPEVSLRMAHFMIKDIPIESNEAVLDFGCAKGYLVLALTMLDIDAWGVDISEYAINQAPDEIRTRLMRISGVQANILRYAWDLIIAKDVLEHLPENELHMFFSRLHCRRLFAAIPQGKDDGKFIIPEYDGDVTHVTAKPYQWWKETFSRHGWAIASYSNTFRGCKENWQSVDGNMFFILEKR